MKDWVSIRATELHLSAIAEMAESQYGDRDDTAQKEYLRHEYFGNPDGEAIAQIAWNEEKKQACGQETLIPKQIKIGNQSVRAFMSVNTITRKEYRGQGIFTTLGRDAVEQARMQEKNAIIYGMPNQNSYHGFTTKMNFTDIGVLPLYLRPLKISGLVKRYLHQNMMSRIMKPLDILTTYRNTDEPASIKFVQLNKGNMFLADDFWDAIKEKYPIMIKRTSKYMEYRFIDIPRRKYEIWYAVKDGRPVAFVIGRVMEVARMQCGMVADFLFLDGCAREAKLLLKHLLHILQDQGAVLAGCLMQSFTDEAKILSSMGFFVCPKAFEPQPFPFIININEQDPVLQMAMKFENWFFVMGDYDVV